MAQPTAPTIAAFSRYYGNTSLVTSSCEAIDNFHDKEFMAVTRLKPTFSAVLYGPPGTGKTEFAKELFLYAQQCSTEYNWRFFEISIQGIGTHFVGEYEMNLTSEFKKVKEYLRQNPKNRAMIFFDEMETIAPSRAASGNDSSRRDSNAVGILLQELCSKLGASTSNTPYLREVCFFLGATNYFKKLDSAVIRPGRFNEKWKLNYLIEVNEVVMIIESFLKENEIDNQIDSDFIKNVAVVLLCSQTVTPSMLATLINDAYKRCCFDFKKTRKNPNYWTRLKTESLKDQVRIKVLNYFNKQHLTDALTAAMQTIIDQPDFDEDLGKTIMEALTVLKSSIPVIGVANDRFDDENLDSVSTEEKLEEECKELAKVKNVSVEIIREMKTLRNQIISNGLADPQKDLKDQFQLLRDRVNTYKEYAQS